MKEDIYLYLPNLTQKERNIVALLIGLKPIDLGNINYLAYGYHKEKKSYQWACFNKWVEENNRIKVNFEEFVSLFKDKQPLEPKDTGVTIDEAISAFNEIAKFNKESLENCFGNIENTTHKVTIKTEDLEVGQTFEYNGYICEVKEKIEESKWYRIYSKEYKRTVYDKLTVNRFEAVKNMEGCIYEEITDYNFINLLEEYSE